MNFANTSNCWAVGEGYQEDRGTILRYILSLPSRAYVPLLDRNLSRGWWGVLSLKVPLALTSPVTTALQKHCSLLPRRVTGINVAQRAGYNNDEGIFIMRGHKQPWNASGFKYHVQVLRDRRTQPPHGGRRTALLAFP